MRGEGVLEGGGGGEGNKERDDGALEREEGARGKYKDKGIP